MNIILTGARVDELWPGLRHRLDASRGPAGAAEPVRTFALDYAVALGTTPEPAPDASAAAKADWVRARVHWVLVAKAGRKKFFLRPGDGMPADEPVPGDIVAAELERLARRHEQLRRAAAMTDQERAAEINAVLGRLAGTAGFAAFRVGGQGLGEQGPGERGPGGPGDRSRRSALAAGPGAMSGAEFMQRLKASIGTPTEGLDPDDPGPDDPGPDATGPAGPKRG